MKTRNARTLWVTDADNTLWDIDSVFAGAQLSLLKGVERIIGQATSASDRLAYVRDLDQRIAAVHHRGLRYSSRLLAIGLMHRLLGFSAEEATKAALKGGDVSDNMLHTVVDQFADDLGHAPDLREGVLEGLQLLREHDATIVVATEGSKARIESTLAFHGLSSYVKSCIEAPKTPQLYRRLAKATPHSQSWMIGDQIDRDIAPAAAAGYRTIYFPGSFLPNWHPKDTTSASAIVKDYRDGVSIATRDEDQRVANGLPAA